MMIYPFASRRVLLGATSALAMTLTAAGVASAQTQPPATTPAGEAQTGQRAPQTQSGQQGQQQLSQALSSIEQANQSIQSAPPNQIRQTAQQVKDPLQKLETSLQGLGSQAGTTVQAAMESIKMARAALDNQQPDKQGIVRSLQNVIATSRRVEQQMAQGSQPGTPGSSAQIGVQQKSAQVSVEQKAPQVIVQQPAPNVTVQQPAPQVTVQQPRPDVTVTQAKPDVTVQQAEPQVTVKQSGEPNVKIERQAAGDTAKQPGSTAQTGTAQTGNDNRIATLGRGLVGKEIYGANDSDVGDVEDVVMQGSQVDAVLVDVGGFLGMGARRVAIPISSLTMRGDRLVTSMTEAQVRNLPEHQTAR